MRPLAAAIAAAVLAVPAAERPLPEVPSAFFIAKSENRNQVHFAVAVDDRCAPRGDEPVSPRWWMLEAGPGVTEPLGSWEHSAYGVASQRVLTRSAAGGSVALSLQALPARRLVITTSARGDGSCAATVTAHIAGANASLESVWVELGLLHVAWIRLQGRTSEGQPISEKVSP